MARRRPVSLRRMPRWRWLKACRTGRLKVFGGRLKRCLLRRRYFQTTFGAGTAGMLARLQWFGQQVWRQRRIRAGNCWRGSWLRAALCRRFLLRRRAAAGRFCRRVGLDAAAGVVLHGADGDDLARDIQAALGRAVPMDGRKMLTDKRCGLMADIERDEVLRLFDFGGDGAGNDVARREFNARGRNAA